MNPNPCNCPNSFHNVSCHVVLSYSPLCFPCFPSVSVYMHLLQNINPSHILILINLQHNHSCHHTSNRTHHRSIFTRLICLDRCTRCGTCPCHTTDACCTTNRNTWLHIITGCLTTNSQGTRLIIGGCLDMSYVCPVGSWDSDCLYNGGNGYDFDDTLGIAYRCWDLWGRGVSLVE